MLKKHVQGLLFILLSTIGYGQSAVLCPKISELIGIEDLSDVPMVNDNGDGTITLISSEQYINDIFANHTIYGFFQTYPNTSPALEQYYTLLYGDKDLITELN